MTIDIATPVIDKISTMNLLDSNTNTENTRIMRNNISNINSEFFERMKAYAGTIFSFQWSLILEEIMVRSTLLEILIIEFK